MAARFGDWDARLAEYLALMQVAPFIWGRTDCAMFAAGAVLAMTGYDPAAEFRGHYGTAIGAAKSLKRYGTGDLAGTYASKLPARPIGYAGRGDLVMHDGAVGVCIGADALFMPLEGIGLVRVPRRDWTQAFAV
jgi:hypothetical protein